MLSNQRLTGAPPRRCWGFEPSLFAPKSKGPPLGVTALAWSRWRWLLIPLGGWWSHILIDVFTHSSEYYPSPVLYPLTERGFDGIAWPTPWFMALNYTAIAVTAVWLLLSSRMRKPRAE